MYGSSIVDRKRQSSFLNLSIFLNWSTILLTESLFPPICTLTWSLPSSYSTCNDTCFGKIHSTTKRIIQILSDTKIFELLATTFITCQTIYYSKTVRKKAPKYWNQFNYARWSYKKLATDARIPCVYNHTIVPLSSAIYIYLYLGKYFISKKSPLKQCYGAMIKMNLPCHPKESVFLTEVPRQNLVHCNCKSTHQTHPRKCYILINYCWLFPSLHVHLCGLQWS